MYVLLRSELDSSGSENLHLDQQKAEEYAALREEASAQTAAERVEELSVDQELKSKQLRVQRLEVQEEAARVEIETTVNQMAEYSGRGDKLKGAITEGEKEKRYISIYICIYVCICIQIYLYIYTYTYI
jgi:hypothetical protein